MEKEKIYANAFNQVLEFGPVRLKKIREGFGGFENAWKAPLDEIRKAVGLEKLQEFREKIKPEDEFSVLEKNKIKILLHDELPRFLKETPYPPEILYVKGKLPEENRIHLAVVGTRRYSTYGQEACEKILADLAEYGMAIVSGLAVGIDAISHKAAISNNTPTIGVLGCGLKEEVFYPPQNLKLMREIVEKGGAVISEHPYSMRAARWTFRQRNRIVVGLSRGVLVVEAPEKSGTLITANFAVDYNRDLFALVGSIFSENSKGTNNLIKAGAIPVTSAEDILRQFGLDPKEAKKEIVLSPLEEKIISALIEPMTRDDLIRKTALSAREVNPCLSAMEIKGLLKESGGEIFKL